MASIGFVESLLGGLAADVKRPMLEAFRYALPNGRFGPVEHQVKAESFQGYYLEATADSSTGEFSIVHGLGRIPYVCVPVLALDREGSRLIPLTVTREADASRVYVKTEAGSTGAVFALYVE